MKRNAVICISLTVTACFTTWPACRAAEGLATRPQIEADWVLQDLRRREEPPMTAAADAAGGCDGVKDGKNVGYYGFHTDSEENAWWQVDLQDQQRLSRAVIYNGSTKADAERALGLIVLVSTDGKQWIEQYRHDGRMFMGPEDPLTVPLNLTAARYVRVQLPYKEHLHLDEIEVYVDNIGRNVALGKPATQSSISQWSRSELEGPSATDLVTDIIERGLKLAANLERVGQNVDGPRIVLRRSADAARELGPDATDEERRALATQARWAIRKMAFANPLLDFNDLLFVKRAPNRLLCHCDEYLSWWSRPGGELCVLEDFAGDSPHLRSLTANLLPVGDIVRPDISFDGERVLFAYCRHYPDLWKKENKLDKADIPEDAFYHLYEMDLKDGGLRRLTRGRYDDFDGRYLPDGRVVFLSTRRGRFIQCGTSSATATNTRDDLPDGFVRCGGDAYRPVSVHTLHVMDADGDHMRTISPFESFEWNPSVAHDGRILYARWDYVDRHRMWHMGLWSTLPDGMGARSVFGNFTLGPYSVFEARSIPDSQKIVFTASAHHSHAGGSLVILDPNKGVDGHEPLTRLTPEVPFPEYEGWGNSYYANPFPLSEDHFLVSWSSEKLSRHAFAPDGSPVPGPIDSLGIYLFDAFGNLNLLYRDPAISSMCPMPIRPRPRPANVASIRSADDPDSRQVAAEAPADPSARTSQTASSATTSSSDDFEEGRMLLNDVYRGDLRDVERGSIRELRVVGIPPKTDPRMNHPMLGVTGDDPGKFVLGTVPVEPDGSAYFRVPAGLPFFLQALDEHGMAVQTMRSATYVQPGRTLACVGCHDDRTTSPPNTLPLATLREPSGIRPGPDGSWPLDFNLLVQPVLDQHCVDCHKPGGDGAAIDLTKANAYEALLSFGGEKSLRQLVLDRYDERRSVAGSSVAQSSPLRKMLIEGHYGVELSSSDWHRLYTWLDTYAQVSGSYGSEQEEQLRELRRLWTPKLSLTGLAPAAKIPSE